MPVTEASQPLIASAHPVPDKVQQEKAAEEEPGNNREEPQHPDNKLYNQLNTSSSQIKPQERSRDGRIRTGDHSAPSRVRYQTAPRPDQGK